MDTLLHYVGIFLILVSFYFGYATLFKTARHMETGLHRLTNRVLGGTFILMPFILLYLGQSPFHLLWLWPVVFFAIPLAIGYIGKLTGHNPDWQ